CERNAPIGNTRASTQMASTTLEARVIFLPAAGYALLLLRRQSAVKVARGLVELQQHEPECVLLSSD
ncbi:MAG: hypothetical protein WAN86_14865, partial [Hyphomicrobiaceae bacterium]